MTTQIVSATACREWLTTCFLFPTAAPCDETHRRVHVALPVGDQMVDIEEYSTPRSSVTEGALLTQTVGLNQLRSFYTSETRELFSVLLNATSAAEANLALEVLRGLVPEKPLVTACNLREVLRTLPSSPFQMAVDTDTLMRAAELEKDIAVLGKRLPDGIELCVTTAGNLVLDLIVKAEGEKHYWTPMPARHDFVNPSVIDLVIASQYLLDSIIELVKAMAIVFNPKFYLSIEDFHLEYAAEAIMDLDDLF
jgi:hypothetical protein